MGKGFNLITDPWIPVSGELLSLEQALIDAHNIDGWPCSDPAFSEALIRLLVPMTYRITGMDDPAFTRYEFAERQGQLLDGARLNPARVHSYLTTHKDRFWLVNPPKDFAPCAQDETLAVAEPKPPSKLVVSWSSGNNPLVGPHAPCGSLSPVEAAPHLLVQRCYAAGGTHTKHPAHTKKGKFVAAALRRTICLHPVGQNLAATLIGHLVPLPPDTAFGRAWWEHDDHEPVATYRHRSGLLEQIAVRQDKTMLLCTDASGDITGFTIAEGRGRNENLECPDPYWITDADSAPVKPAAGRAFWRESQALLDKTDGGAQRASALILDWALDADGGADNYPPNSVAWVAVSHRGDKNKDLAWSCSHAPNLLSIFEPAAALRCIEFLAAAAEAESQMCKQLARAWHGADLMPSKTEDKNAVYAPARSTFWGCCEAAFWDTALRPVDAGRRDELLRGYALAGFDDATAHLLRERRSHLAVVESRRWIERWRREPEPSRQPEDAAL